jgi:hypothetical protein
MGVKIMLSPLLNIAELLSYKYIIMTVDAVRKVEELWGEKSAPEAVGSVS